MAVALPGGRRRAAGRPARAPARVAAARHRQAPAPGDVPLGLGERRRSDARRGPRRHRDGLRGPRARPPLRARARRRHGPLRLAPRAGDDARRGGRGAHGRRRARRPGPLRRQHRDPLRRPRAHRVVGPHGHARRAASARLGRHAARARAGPAARRHRCRGRRRDLAQARRVARLKSGAYTVQRPLLLGALAARAERRRPGRPRGLRRAPR